MNKLHSGRDDSPQTRAITATVMHTPVQGEIEVLKDALILIDPKGVITQVLDTNSADYTRELQNAKKQGVLHTATSTQCLLPGLVDTHIHAPQWPQLGKALHLPLQDWLVANTFPLEARYEDAAFAHSIYQDLVSSLLANGTTTAVYFATIHAEATRVLVDLCLEQGQRAFVGRVAMDDAEQCPNDYRDTDADTALMESQAQIDYTWQQAGESQLVQPVITPRFIPSCTDALLQGLGDMAQQTGCHVQTHCSESDWEHAFVQQRLGKSDTHSLDDFGLLTRRTILAHSNFISDDDMAMIHRRQSGVAHCPLSNVYFSNSVFPLKRALERGVHVGLGTDISGGPSASVFDACRAAIVSSRVLNDGTDPSLAAQQRGRGDARIDFDLAFWVATVGAGCMLDVPVGMFKTGYYFDAMLIDYGRDDSNIRVFDELDSDDDIFQKIVYATQRQDIRQVWVNGQRVVDKHQGE